MCVCVCVRVCAPEHTILSRLASQQYSHFPI